MRRRRLILSTVPFVLTAVVLAGCATQTDTTAAPATAAESTTSTETAVVIDSDLQAEAVIAANSDATVTRDDEWSEDDAIDVDLDDATDASGVTVSDATVTITEAGVYRLTGSLDGSVVVAAQDDALVVLILDGVDIANPDGPAIQVVSADDVAISLAAGSENTVSDASAYADDADANAAIYADTDLTITGTGSLTVTGNGNDGIASTDDLVVLSGDITVDAVDDGLRGKDSLTVEGGTLEVTAGGDALKSDQDDDATTGWILLDGGDLTATSGDDALSAFTDVLITGGTISLDAGVGDTASDSAKGIAAGAVAALDGGEIAITSTDDAVNSDGSVGIGGAVLELVAGDDGVHAEQTLEIRSGSVTVDALEGLEAPVIVIEGGEIAVNASDDGINASVSDLVTSGVGISISGGDITIVMGSGDTDAIDSNGDLTITGGTFDITANSSFDYDGNGSMTGATVTVNGEAVTELTNSMMGPGGGMGGGPGGGRP